jgi:antitoxin (DNA-binding transcriptional repressor) of toxin-antitoxin stability system
MEFTVHEAKTHFSKLVHQALSGMEVIITSGRERTRIAKLVPFEDQKAIRVGWLAGKMPAVGPDHPFFEPLPHDELGAWSGEGE